MTNTTNQTEPQAEPLFFYRWVDGVSRRIGAIVRDGRTLYGPVRVS